VPQCLLNFLATFVGKVGQWESCKLRQLRMPVIKVAQQGVDAAGGNKGCSCIWVCAERLQRYQRLSLQWG
jgi:hypothetical protein